MLVRSSRANNNVIQGKDQVALSLNALDLQENEERSSASVFGGNVIYFTKVNGSLMLSKASIKSAGLL
ncbi:hypothetical protein [Paenibacillus pini]|uniref:Uncharacterized protein n=1 Tax=Paenibacillus pini JCM 16418 TaxID=1236976 RepID=W7YT95_9BACL|nr:hypothetical protein [Paenibacillus pini]GAF07846.1 hypothetical protein JCM16418_1877 [Paenibacillus pini JCM 16418]